MSGPFINFPTVAEEQEALAAFYRRQSAVRAEKRAEALRAGPALVRLVEAMRHQTGQGFKIRALLFSLWNGKPARLSDVLVLDWELRKDFASVLLAFGYEDAELKCFYSNMEEAVRTAGLWMWFLEEGVAL